MADHVPYALSDVRSSQVDTLVEQLGVDKLLEAAKQLPTDKERLHTPEMFWGMIAIYVGDMYGIQKRAILGRCVDGHAESQSMKECHF